MKADLARWAEACGHVDWGYGGPHDAPTYCCQPHESDFFHPNHGRWKTSYGQFFLSWYSDRLVQHVHAMLQTAQQVLAEPGRPRLISSETCSQNCLTHLELTFRSPVRLGIKLAGVHWCYTCASHPAEATAGYFNCHGHNGYAPFFRAVAAADGVVSFTCVEMRDCEHPPEGACSPEQLLQQILCTAQAHGTLSAPAPLMALLHPLFHLLQCWVHLHGP
jgi:beta-amylase